MTNAMTTYVGMMVGGACCIGHLIFCRVKHEAWPPMLRVLLSAIAGFGAIPVLQLAAVVLRPPTDRPIAIFVDDYRVSLFLGMLALAAASVWSLHDNWKAMRRVRRRKP